MIHYCRYQVRLLVDEIRQEIQVIMTSITLLGRFPMGGEKCLKTSCLNFWDEARWVLSLRVFRLLSSSLLLFLQRFGRYVLRSNSGTFMELRTTSFIETTGVACSDSISHNRVQVLSIPVLLLACSEDWTCSLQMIVALEAYGTNTYNRYAMCPAGQFRVNFWDL